MRSLIIEGETVTVKKPCCGSKGCNSKLKSPTLNNIMLLQLPSTLFCVISKQRILPSPDSEQSHVCGGCRSLLPFKITHVPPLSYTGSFFIYTHQKEGHMCSIILISLTQYTSLSGGDFVFESFIKNGSLHLSTDHNPFLRKRTSFKSASFLL